jgi:3'-phosphoadenosine 5'-phosphosulfate sulfotransferase (PAPS reductase)/FAD synthetase
MKINAVLGILAMLCGSLASQAQSGWKQTVKDELPLLGHRNWIVIVDSAYPLQSSPGVETIDTGADHLAVLDYVLAELKNSRHVRPLVHTDKELEFVSEKGAPGVERYRQELKMRLSALTADAVLHQQLIDRLAETGKNFHVLVLKTHMAIPYTSVFLQLDCQYWSADAEARMREAMKGPEHKQAKP